MKIGKLAVLRRGVAATLLFCTASAVAQSAQVEIAPRSSPEVSRYASASRNQTLSREAKLKLLRQKVKYVFVLFQENRSFDFYFGAYPGANGLYSQPPSQTPGFIQPIVNVDGSIGTISPFRIPASIVDAKGKTVQLYPMDVASVNHAHVASVKKLNLDAQDIARNDRYAVTEEGVDLVDGKPNKFPTLARKQMGEVVMGHIDCDMAPFLWRYADRFTLFDHFMDTEIGPSTPNAIAMISGQTGETQWMLHTETTGVPVLADPYPFWGSKLDLTKDAPEKAGEAIGKAGPATQKHDVGRQPQPKPSDKPAPNLTFATLPLSFMGTDIERTTAADRDAAFDLLDVKDDIAKIAAHGVAAVPWGWYQEGYNREPTDTGAVSHNGYVVHHNAPQYFGYVSNNPEVSDHMHGLGEFFGDVRGGRLPAQGGAFYVRGGSGNLHGYKPLDPNPQVQSKYSGDDDHPGYSDSQISEALIAEEVNAIARSPYWKDSVILIAYDETDGLYDHARPRVRSHDRAGLALNQGPRIPSLLISPYGVAHGISHEPVEHSSIIKLVDELFGLIPLADLPDEMRGRQIGKEKFGQKDLGPADDFVEGVGDMLSGFDDARLMGKRKPLPASYAEIPDLELSRFPHYGGEGCKALGIRPTDFGKPNPIPADFNPRPMDSPGIPMSGDWKP